MFPQAHTVELLNQTIYLCFFFTYSFTVLKLIYLLTEVCETCLRRRQSLVVILVCIFSLRINCLK